MAKQFLIRKTTEPVVKLRVEADSEEEALERARRGDGEVVEPEPVSLVVEKEWAIEPKPKITPPPATGGTIGAKAEGEAPRTGASETVTGKATP